LPRLAPDARVLDVGCGPGTITADLAARVPGGDVTAIDAAADVLAQARQEAERRGLDNVRFDTGDVYRLDFADGTFDVVHAHQVLQHLTDPVAALREMRRVCRPGGLVAARDGDYGGFFWYPEEPEMTEWLALYRAVARAIGGEPDAGRHLLASWADRLTKSPFGDRAVEHGLATRDDLERLAGAWLRWADSEDAWFLIPHGEVLARA
jgi:SAM-dependent methyltransferase